MSRLVANVKQALKNADLCRSNVSYALLDMEGMSGKKTRHFYNNVCSMEDARYLEVGSWKGSTLCSAMAGNQMTCVAIDDWSEFGGPKEEFVENFNKYKGENNARFIEGNCWEIDSRSLGKFNIYMYDGKHTTTSHFDALHKFSDCLDDEFIYLVDDWNWLRVRNGTMAAIEENQFEVLWKKEIMTTPNNAHPEPECSGKNSEWHNGICIFVLKQ